MRSDDAHHTQTATSARPRTLVVRLPIEIDVTNHEQVYDTLTQALCASATVLIADATGTTFCDCAGVKALIGAHHQAAAAGAQLRVAASPAISRILALTDTNHLLNTYPALDAALDSEQQPRHGSARPPWLPPHP